MNEKLESIFRKVYVSTFSNGKPDEILYKTILNDNDMVLFFGSVLKYGLEQIIKEQDEYVDDLPEHQARLYAYGIELSSRKMERIIREIDIEFENRGINHD